LNKAIDVFEQAIAEDKKGSANAEEMEVQSLTCRINISSLNGRMVAEVQEQLIFWDYSTSTSSSTSTLTR
jgi:hypothetical protein